MKNTSPKKTFSGSTKGRTRKSASSKYGKSYTTSERKERPAQRPYVRDTKYGANAKSSSYRGKDFREELERKRDEGPVYAKKFTPRIYSSSVPSSSKFAYKSDNRTAYKEKNERLSTADQFRSRTPSRLMKKPDYNDKGVSTKRSKFTHDSKSVDSKTLHTTNNSLPSKHDTSWGGVATWYDDHLEKSKDTYHEKVIYPGLLRILGDVEKVTLLDLACGQGQFSRRVAEKGATVTGVDLGKELITLAEEANASLSKKATKVTYYNGSADDLYMLKDNSFDAVVCVLALQNIEQLQKTVGEVSRVLRDGGTFTFVLNHPSFRNPRNTRWSYDEDEHVQYRRVDEYMRESSVKIDMTPGNAKNKKYTVSFHRPLQVYVKALSKCGLVITSLEEWVSHKESEEGPRQLAENRSRREIPLFMCISTRKV